MPRLRKDRDETPSQRRQAVHRFREGHLTGRENADRGPGRDPSIATRRRTPDNDERAGVRAGERGESLAKATKKRFG